jgi:hypothetical protein
MNRWVDIALVACAVLLSLAYAAYTFGPKSLRDRFTRFVTRHFGLGAARYFSGSAGCSNCGPAVKKPLFGRRDLGRK